MSRERTRLTKERLRRYVSLKQEIAAQTARLDELNLASLYPPQALDGMPRTPAAHETRSDALVKLMEMKETILRSIRVAQAEALWIENAIQRLANPSDRELMRLKYLDGLTWDEVSKRLHRSRQWIAISHGKILQKIH